mgnify:CR=1 FL=1
MIMEKNSRLSAKTTEILATQKSNVSLKKQRPSINVVPTFLSNSTKKNDFKENIPATENESSRKFFKSQHSHSLQSSKSRNNKVT